MNKLEFKTEEGMRRYLLASICLHRQYLRLRVSGIKQRRPGTAPGAAAGQAASGPQNPMANMAQPAR